MCTAQVRMPGGVNDNRNTAWLGREAVRLTCSMPAGRRQARACDDPVTGVRVLVSCVWAGREYERKGAARLGSGAPAVGVPGAGRRMSGFDHALAWVHGERMEGAAAIALGLLLVLGGGLLWKFAATPAARAMVAPLLIVGVPIVGIGIAMEIQNVRRIGEFVEAHALDPAAFVAQEIARIEGFTSWYVYTFAAGAVLIVGGLAAFLFVPGPTLKGIGLTMIVIGTAALFFDFFSKARAGMYLEGLLGP